MPIITADLCEACSHDALNHSTVARWFKQFQEERLTETYVRTGCPSIAIDNTLIAIVSRLLDKGR